MLIFTSFEVHARVQNATFKFKFITWNRGTTHNEHSTDEGHSPETCKTFVKIMALSFHSSLLFTKIVCCLANINQIKP